MTGPGGSRVRGATRGVRGIHGAVLGTGRLLRALLLLAVLVVLAFCITTVPGAFHRDDFDPLVDGWVHGTAYLLTAVVCAARPLRYRVDRTAWCWIAAGVALRALGFLLFFGVVRGQDPQPYPSLADVAWLLSYPVLAVGLVLQVRGAFSRLSTTLALDALVGALVVTAVAVQWVFLPLLDLAGEGSTTTAVVTNLAYAVIDVALLLVVIGTLAAHRWRPPPAGWVLGAGVLCLSVTDAVFVYQAAAGTFRAGTPLSGLSLIASALVASAAWLPGWTQTRPLRDPLPGLALPTVFALGCTTLLVLATQRPLDPIAIALVVLGILVVLGRTTLAFKTLRVAAADRVDARTDELTGIPNRRGLAELFSRRVGRTGPQHRAAVLMIDLTGFREVKNAYGHHIGDQVLSLLASRMRDLLQPEDLLARVGGDEFAVVIAGLGGADAMQRAGQLRVACCRPMAVGDADVRVDADVGIALRPLHGVDLGDLLECADLAMCAAKAAHSGVAVFSDGQQRATRGRAATATRLHQAIDAGELEVHYQPQVSLRRGSVVGLEALVRWRHPEQGLLLPAHFVPQAEGSGLIRVLTAEVLAQSARQAAALQAAGTSVPISVNVSVTDLLDPDFPEEVAGVLDRAQIPGGGLVLELTEHLFLSDPDRAAAVIAGLRLLGVDLVVDDYGTGYCSLGYLRDLPGLRGLKLDRSFVDRIDVDERSRAIVASTASMAHELGLEVVAEGVETEQVRDVLADLGCERAQGYLFGRPVPAGELRLGQIPVARARRWGVAGEWAAGRRTDAG